MLLGLLEKVTAMPGYRRGAVVLVTIAAIAINLLTTF